MDAFEYDRPSGDAELERHAGIMAWSFRFPEDRIGESFRRVGTEHVRVLRKDGRTIGGLTLYPLGQYVGGRPVPMTGVNLVGIDPAHRGGGAATFLMESAVREMAQGEAPLSALYPAKQTLYRRAGFELAGTRWEHRARLADLGAGARTGSLREVRPDDLDDVKRLYRRRMESATGPLDRPPFFWRRIVDPLGDRKVRTFLIDGADGPEGYFVLETKEGEGFHHDLALGDLVVLTPDAARKALRFLGDHASMAKNVSWFGDANDPLFHAVPEQTWETRAAFRWMVRLLDVPRALTARGVPTGLRAAVDLHVDDPLLEENAGAWRVEVADGRTTVERGGTGAARVDVRGLASLYTGYVSARQLLATGLLRADADTVAALEQVFPPGNPWMPDMF